LNLNGVRISTQREHKSITNQPITHLSTFYSVESLSLVTAVLLLLLGLGAILGGLLSVLGDLLTVLLLRLGSVLHLTVLLLGLRGILDLAVLLGLLLDVLDLPVLLLRLSIHDLLGLGVDDLLLVLLGLAVLGLAVLLLLAELGRHATANTTSEGARKTAKRAAKGAIAEKTLKSHAWLEFLAESALGKLILKGKTSERRRSECWLAEFVFLRSSLYRCLGCLNVTELCAELDVATEFDITDGRLVLATNFKFRTIFGLW